MKKQQWLFKVFSMINSSSSATSSFNNGGLCRRSFCSTAAITNTTLAAPSRVADLCRRSFCSTAAITNTTLAASSRVADQPPPVISNNTKQQQQQLFNILLEKKLPLLIVPYDHVTEQKYVDCPHRSLDGGGFVCDGTLGFISLFHGDDDDKRGRPLKKQEEVEFYKMYLPEIAKRRICRSSEGWLFTIHRNGEIQLINPVTRAIVHLPSLTAIPGVTSEFISKSEDTKGRLTYFTNIDSARPDYYSKYASHVFREMFIGKAVTNTTTTTTTTTTTCSTTTSISINPATVVVIIYHTFEPGLAFCRTTGNGINDDDDEPAAKRWIKIPYNDTYQTNTVDVTFYKGNFYEVGAFGNVAVLKGLDGPSPFMQCVADVPEAEPEYYSHMNYLVESPSSSSSSGGGDLLMVMRDIKNIDELYVSIEEGEEEEEEEEEIFEHPYRTIGFKVWKLDLNGPSWEKVTDLGEDCALFVGYNHSFSFLASKFPGCRGNCIYFIDNKDDKIFVYPTGGHDIGVYNLEDGSFEKLYETSSSQLFMPPALCILFLSVGYAIRQGRRLFF